MRVSKIDWDATAGRGECEVEKLGQVLSGTAGFVVEPDPLGSRIEWFEDVDVKSASTGSESRVTAQG